jgi:hypothetical protein
MACRYLLDVVVTKAGMGAGQGNIRAGLFSRCRKAVGMVCSLADRVPIFEFLGQWYHLHISSWSVLALECQCPFLTPPLTGSMLL